MNDEELKARKAAVNFVNAHFTDLESLDRVKDVYDDVYKAHEASRQQLEEQVNVDEFRCQPPIIRLEAKFQRNIGFTVRRVLAVFMRSAITLPNVNRFGLNLEHSKYIVGGWPQHILGAIDVVATNERQLESQANFFT